MMINYCTDEYNDKIILILVIIIKRYLMLVMIKRQSLVVRTQFGLFLDWVQSLYITKWTNQYYQYVLNRFCELCS